MVTKYHIGEKLFCIIDGEIYPCEVLQCVIKKDGIFYKVGASDKYYTIEESLLLKNICTEEFYKMLENSTYYIIPIEEGHQGEYKSTYSLCNVFIIKDAKISILRDKDHKYSSYIDIKGMILGSIKTSTLETFGFNVPRIIDRTFGKIDEDERVKFMLQINNICPIKRKTIFSTILPLDFTQTEVINRIRYTNELDDLLLKINPNIQDCWVSLENTEEFNDLKIEKDYSYNTQYLILRGQSPLPKRINYYSLSHVEVEVEFIKEYSQHKSKVLPSYKVYKILRFKNIDVESIIPLLKNK